MLDELVPLPSFFSRCQQRIGVIAALRTGIQWYPIHTSTSPLFIVDGTRLYAHPPSFLTEPAFFLSLSGTCPSLLGGSVELGRCPYSASRRSRFDAPATVCTTENAVTVQSV